MERGELSKHTYSYVPGDANTHRVLILLHGTGGSDVDMLALGEALDPTAHLISVLGNVRENGAARFFRRSAEGIYDLIDLARRTEDLEYFIFAAINKHKLEGKIITLVGYSNGANISISLLLKNTKVAKNLIAIRPFYPNLPETQPMLANSILLLSGKTDPLTTAEQTNILAAALQKYGAKIESHFVPSGHELSKQDLEISQHWLLNNAQ